MRDCLHEILNENCLLTLTQLNQELRQRLPRKPRICDRTEARSLEGMLFRIKLARPVPADRNRPDVIQKRLDYANWFIGHAVVNQSVWKDFRITPCIYYARRLINYVWPLFLKTKTGYRALSFRRFSSSPTSVFLCFSSLCYPGSLRICFPFFLVPHQVSNHLPLAYLSPTSFSSTPLHYEVQLRITPPKIIYILPETFAFPKLCMTTYLFKCLTHAARKHASHLWVPGE